MMIIHTLTRTIGEGNFDYTLTGDGLNFDKFDETDLEDLDFEELEHEDDADTIDGNVLRRIDRGSHQTD